MSHSPTRPEKNEEGVTLLRRDALKAVAMLASAPLSGSVARAAQSPSAQSSASAEDSRDQLFDAGWKFLRGDAQGAERSDFNDTAWRALDLPHDWSVEDLPPRPGETTGAGAVWGLNTLPARVGPFDTELSEGGRDTGWFVGGVGWYRKRFRADRVPPDAHVEIVFDGVYMNSDVWLNGVHLGNRPYGYSAFAYDLTPHLRRDGENVIAVRARNEGKNTRWYAGSGIYRHVRLNTTGRVRVPLWGVFVTTPEVADDQATVNVAVSVENRADSARQVAVRVRLLDPNNTEAGAADTTQTLAAGATTPAELSIAVNRPQLWSTDTPRLYRAEVILSVDGETTDRTSTSFGIRRVEVDAERGLRLNGREVVLKGACMHHDNGLLGAAAIDRAEERRVEIMKKNGFNAIRTAHNPPSVEFLDACDRLGMLVMDEALDQWERQKDDKTEGYQHYFADWWQRDIDAMVLRDRNHPSVIFWSIGNEIPERADPRGVEIAGMLTSRIRSLDPTRHVTAGINGWGTTGEELDPAFVRLDVAGYNYMLSRYEEDHERHPARVIVGTESFPREAFQSWQPVEKHPYVIGDFVWTGMDHLGESAIGNAQVERPRRQGGGGPARGGGNAPWPSGMASIQQPFPWFNCYCGDINLIGDPKPQMYYRRVLWGLSRLEMAVQRPVREGYVENISPWGWSDELRSWTWPGYEGHTLKVRVYSSGDQVRLLLNGREIGVQQVSLETELKAEFEVPYAAGELKTVALEDGQQISEAVILTVGPPARLRLTADRQRISRSRNDLSFVTLEVLDEAGNLVPDAVVPVTFTLSGAGELAAVGTANPKDVHSFRRRNPNTFHGKCLAIVRPTGTAGRATVRAEAGGLTAASLDVQVA